MSDSEDAFQSADEGDGDKDTKPEGSSEAASPAPAPAKGGSKAPKRAGQKQTKGKSKKAQPHKGAAKPNSDVVEASAPDSKLPVKSMDDPPQAPDLKAVASDSTPASSDPSDSSNPEPKASDTAPAKVETVDVTSSHSDGDPGASPNSIPEPKSADQAPERQKVLENLTQAAEKQSGWGGWGGWGSSLLNTATSSVATFTSQVGEGFNAVLDTVESSLGAPDPEELVKQDLEARRLKEPDATPNGQSEPPKEAAPVEEGDVDQTMDRGTADVVEDEAEGEAGGEAEASSDAGDKPENASDWFASWGASGLSGLSSLTQHVQSTGKTLVTGSLDVLETVGKRAYDVIAEGDHGLKKTIERAGNKSNLSQTLREAKDVYEADAEKEAEFVEARKAHFGSLFDEYNGLVHLEALELVSNTSEGKVHSILGTLSEEKVGAVKKQMVALREAFKIEEEDDDEDEEKDHNFSQLATEHTRDLCLPVKADNLTACSNKARAWLHDCQEEQQQGVKMAAKEVHQEAIQTLARMTACSVQHFHKVAQLVQLNPEGPMSVHKEQAESLAKLTQVVCAEIEILSSRFTDRLTSAGENSEEPDSVNPLITNVYLEAGNGKTYTQDAFQLLLPVMQHASLTVFTKQ